MANKKAEILTMDGQVVSPITLATNVLLDDGRTAQDLLDSRDESMFSPTITTSSSISKVGQGDNVDFSENVIDGAYKSCVLKGKTLVNYNAEGNDRNEYVCMPSVEGSNLTVNGTVEGKVKSAILSGQTLNYLLPYKSFSCSNPQGYNVEESNIVRTVYDNHVHYSLTLHSGRVTTISFNHAPNKQTTIYAGKTYTLYIPNYTHQNVKNKWLLMRDNNHAYNYTPIKQNSEYFVFTAIEDFDYLGLYQYFDFDSTYLEKTVECNVSQHAVIVEGDYFNQPLPLLEQGLNSCKMPVLTTTGKNLFDYKNYGGQDINIVEIENGLRVSTWACSLPFINNLLPNTQYTSKSVVKVVEEQVGATDIGAGKIYIYNGTTYFLLFNPGGGEYTFTTPSDIKSYNRILFYAHGGGGSKVGVVDITNMQIEEGSTATSYEPFKSNILTVNEEVELGSVGEVKDELNLLTGQLTQRTETRAYQEGDESNSEVLTDMTNTRYKLPKEAIKTVDLSDNVVYSYKDTTHYTCSSEDGSLLPTLAIEEGVKYKAIIKPSTKYSIVFNRTEVASGLTVDLGGATANITSTTLGKNIVQITTPPTLSHNYVIFKGLGNAIKDVQVIEGDVVGDEPYFEGMVDVEMPVVKNVGKNLFDGKERLWFIEDNGKIPEQTVWRDWITDSYIQIDGGKKYYSNIIDKNKSFYFYDSNKNFIEAKHNISASDVLAPINAKYMLIKIAGFRELRQKVAIYEGDFVTTSYEPYKSNTVTFNQKEDKTIVLRSLPNGVCDTLNVETGEYIQRIGEKVLNGSEVWSYFSSEGYVKTDTIDFFHPNNTQMKNAMSVCDTFIKPIKGTYQEDIEGVSCTGGNGQNIWVSIKRSKLSTQDLVGFKTWLSQNPITVQYELATPIVSTIDVQGFPYAYANGHVQLSSGHSEQSLTPTIEYSLIANRLGQIQSNQKLVEKQQTQIDELESMVIANLVNTQYQQALNEIKLGVK